MHHIIEGPTCSECGSSNSEFFSAKFNTGYRCRDCGHERIIAQLTASPAESTTYVKKPEDKWTF